MILIRIRQVKPHIWPLLFASFLSACGGGSEIVAVVQIVTPLGGGWLLDPASDDEKLDLNANLPDDVFFSSNLSVTATVTTKTNVCGGGVGPLAAEVDLVGTLKNGAIELRRKDPPNNTSNCLQGRFTDLRTLEITPTSMATRLYRNGRVDVQMALGLWVSNGGNPLKLKFKEPDSVDNDDTASVEGCDLSGVQVVEFVGDMQGFDTNTNSKPLISELRSDDLNNFLLFSQVVYHDGATLKLLDSQGNPLTLRRTKDNTTTCP